MIQSLQLRNYQSHKSSLLDFDPGVNVIVGQSDSGKTSILRALRKLTWNRPTGDAMRSTWGGTTEVTAQTDQDKIIWAKNNTESGYQLNKQTHFKAIGTDVPAEIRQALNINEINLQQQLDSPFLLTSSPGEVAAHFNKVAKLNKIDEGLKNVNSWIREISRKIDANKLILSNSMEQLKEYNHLEKFDAEVEVLEEMEKRLEKLGKNKYDLIVCIDGIDDVLDLLDTTSEILSDADLVNNTLDLIYKRDALEDGPLTAIEELITQVEIIDSDLQEFTSLTALESQVNDLFELIHQLEKKEQQWENLNQLKTEIGATVISIEAYQSMVNIKTKEFNTLFPNQCPLCGKPK